MLAIGAFAFFMSTTELSLALHNLQLPWLKEVACAFILMVGAAQMAKLFSTTALSFGIEEMVTGREVVDSEEHKEPFCFTEKTTDLPIKGVKF